MTLDEYIDGTTEPPNRETWVCDTDAKAAWLVRMIAKARERAREILAQAQAEMDLVAAWADLESGRPERDEAWALAHLTAYATAQREEGRKSIRTPHGTVNTRTDGGGLLVHEPTLLAWLRESHPDWIETIEKAPAKTALKGLLAVQDGVALDPATSEIVPGIEVAPTGVSVTVKTT